MANRVAYFGPAGTFTEAASLKYDPEAQLLPFPSIAAVAAAVDAGMAEEGVVPIENSLEGSVTDTLDLLIHESRLSIRHELVIPIEHCLLVKPALRHRTSKRSTHIPRHWGSAGVLSRGAFHQFRRWPR